MIRRLRSRHRWLAALSALLAFGMLVWATSVPRRPAPAGAAAAVLREARSGDPAGSPAQAEAPSTEPPR